MTRAQRIIEAIVGKGGLELLDSVATQAYETRREMTKPGTLTCWDSPEHNHWVRWDEQGNTQCLVFRNCRDGRWVGAFGSTSTDPDGYDNYQDAMDAADRLATIADHTLED